jgi:esterase/lipase superfamily enzyme
MLFRAICNLNTRRHFLGQLSTAVAFGVSGCVPDIMAAGNVTASAVLPSPPGYDPTLLAITNRNLVKGGVKTPWFGHERSSTTTLARVVFNRPDTTIVGRAKSSWNGFWTIKSVSPEPRAIIDTLSESVSGKDVLLYIHGYKESFESASINAMELTEGTGFSGMPVAFSWPSRAALFDYGYDRESALISRDSLEETLIALLAENGARRVHIVAHSMGTLLTIETLRQMWARHGDNMAGRIGTIVLASADMDLDLFSNAVQRLRSLVPKMTVISSTSDRALEVSRRLAGGVSRTGGATREQLEGLGVKVVDATDHGGWALVKHDLFLSDPEVRMVVRRAIDRAN